ncbi:DUF6265 family protein, partial [Flavobacteriales bacterium]|nr:DUF6265 family protein [Flavobacteriales bacterium]
IALYSCGEDKAHLSKLDGKSNLEKSDWMSGIDWIAGDWNGTIDSTKITEKWIKVDTSKLMGRAWFIKENDTLTKETMWIEKINNEIYYTVDHPSNQEIVSFLLIDKKPNQLIFENKAHDFPTRIKYTYQQPDNLHIVVSGKENNKRKEINFYFKKLR